MHPLLLEFKISSAVVLCRFCVNPKPLNPRLFRIASGYSSRLRTKRCQGTRNADLLVKFSGPLGSTKKVLLNGRLKTMQCQDDNWLRLKSLVVLVITAPDTCCRWSHMVLLLFLLVQLLQTMAWGILAALSFLMLSSYSVLVIGIGFRSPTRYRQKHFPGIF